MDNSERWKLEIRDNDEILIPIINFNFYTNYPNLKNSSFTIDDKNYSIEEIKQMVKFKLDQNGATVESEFETIVVSVGELEEIKPKKLIFDSKNRKNMVDKVN